MYDWWVAVVIGIVEGVTEFLPVSSTGHMILAGTLLGVSEADERMKSFEIVIQLGAIVAVAIVYWKRIAGLFRFGNKKQAARKGLNLLHILLAILPAMTVAYLLSDWIKERLFSPETVLIGLVLGGILLIIGEKQQSAVTADDVDKLSYYQAFMIGLWQIVALWPGFSRSGSTIAGGMLAGASRSAAADFSFIIAIPVMVAATGYEMLKSAGSFSSADFGFFAIGFAVSFVVALLAVVTFIKFVQRFSLTFFAYYRFVLAALFWFFLLL
ncbi:MULTISPECIES: undecaprenyl-diphosphate phosphatase [unclassified Paenibacillus]|uniref:undecaprenyl-diphosphate phosphatase n=1 Tax=unclassified Paenibacillus TaxID=185978 RepID=UPI0021184737|nr:MULTISPECIES: undecaprenyl-diphosphate phosphatase [unclassified Paenibacillus]